MSPVTTVFTFFQPHSQGLTNIPVYSLDLRVVYMNEKAMETLSN